MDKIYLDDDVVERLQEIALKSDVRMSDVVKELLDFHGDDQVIIDAIKTGEYDHSNM